MRIEALVANYSPETLRSSSGESRSAKARGTYGSVPTRRTDSVQISDEARKRLDQVQKRIEQGFYNSSSVAEDITDKLGRVLNDIT